MLYRLARFFISLSFHLYIKRLSFVGKENIPKDSPVLFAATHSNSFLDALFLAGYFYEKEVYALARGDAFRKNWMSKILYAYRLLPIFRQGDGAADMNAQNERTFQACQQLFREKKQILIYPEGVCKHQTRVLPLMKGAAYMVQRAWSEQIPVVVVPVATSYDSFWKWGKKVDVIIGKPIYMTDFQDITERSFLQTFNNHLTEKLRAQFPSPFQFEKNQVRFGIFGQITYYVAWIFNFPLYFFCMFLGKKISKSSVFHDSITFGLLVVFLPIYWTLLFFLFYFGWQ